MEEVKNDSLKLEDEINVDELTEEERLRYRLQEADIELEKYEDILPENMDEETYFKMQELKQEIKSLRKELKNNAKKENSNSIWEKINIWYVVWGVLAFISIVYPLGPLFSAYYLTLVKSILTLIADNVTNVTLQKILVFLIYLIYFIFYLVIDLVIYKFIKKNKINFWTMISIVSVHIITSAISISFVIDSFF